MSGEMPKQDSPEETLEKMAFDEVSDGPSDQAADEEMDSVLAELEPMTDAEREEEGDPLDSLAEAEEKSNEPREREDAEPDPERERMEAILSRAKVPQAAIDSLTDKELSEWAKSLGEAQATQDETYRKLTELEKGDPEGAEEGSGEEDPEGQPSDRADNPDPELKEFAEIYGDEAAAEVSKFIDSRVQRAEARSSYLESALEGMMIRDAVSRLRERFPQLDEQGGIDEAVSKATKLLETGEYGGADVIHDAMKAASLQLWAEDELTREASARNARRSAKRNGTSTGVRRNGTPTGNNLSTQDREDRVLAALEAGANLDDARRAWGD